MDINGKTVNVSATIDKNAISFSYCDEMRYPYTISGKYIRITSDWTTQVACCRMSNGLFQDEVNDTFVGSTMFELSGNTLIFKDYKGKEKVRMVR